MWASPILMATLRGQQPDEVWLLSGWPLEMCLETRRKKAEEDTHVTCLKVMVSIVIETEEKAEIQRNMVLAAGSA